MFNIIAYIISAITLKSYWNVISCIYKYVGNKLMIINGRSNIYLEYFFPVVKSTAATGTSMEMIYPILSIELSFVFLII